MNTLEFLKDYFNKDDYFIIYQKYSKIDKHEQSQLSLQNTYTQKQLNLFHHFNKDKDADIYFSLNTFNYQQSFYPKRDEHKVKTIKSFYFDIDKGDIEKTKSDIIEMFGNPTYYIESSKGKFQFIYKFKDPVIVESFDQIEKHKQLQKGLLYHFNVDKTFDCSRVFRLTDYMTKKEGNDNFVVTLKKNDDELFTYEKFENIAKNYILDEVIKEKKVLKPKETKTIDNSPKKAPKQTVNSFDQYKHIKKIINRKYMYFMTIHDDDNSVADIAYSKWLKHTKKLNDEEIIKKVFEARSYDNLILKHGYQIEYYFNNILTKI